MTTYIVSNELPGEPGVALIEAGKTAFIQTHVVVLTTAAVVIAVLAVAVSSPWRDIAIRPAHIIDGILQSSEHADH